MKNILKLSNFSMTEKKLFLPPSSFYNHFLLAWTELATSEFDDTGKKMTP